MVDSQGSVHQRLATLIERREVAGARLLYGEVMDLDLFDADERIDELANVLRERGELTSVTLTPAVPAFSQQTPEAIAVLIDDVRAKLALGWNLEAIKQVRATSGAGLRVAKCFVEAIRFGALVEHTLAPSFVRALPPETRFQPHPLARETVDERIARFVSEKRRGALARALVAWRGATREDAEIQARSMI